MKEVYIIHENMDWTKHLTKRLEELDVPYEDWDLSKGLLDIEDLPSDGVYYNRMSASSHTRGNRYAPELTDQILSWLEQKGARVINGTGAIELEVSKLKQYLALQSAGIKTPKTIGAVGKENIMNAAEKLNQFPFIIKSVDGHIIPSEFIGREYFYAVKVDSSEGFELCPADICQIGPDGKVVSEVSKFKIIDRLPKDQIDRYNTFLTNQNIDVAALEFIINESGDVYTYDVNTNTNYNDDAEAVAEKYAMLELAKYLKSELEQI